MSGSNELYKDKTKPSNPLNTDKTIISVAVITVIANKDIYEIQFTSAFLLFEKKYLNAI